MSPLPVLPINGLRSISWQSKQRSLSSISLNPQIALHTVWHILLNDYTVQSSFFFQSELVRLYVNRRESEGPHDCRGKTIHQVKNNPTALMPLQSLDCVWPADSQSAQAESDAGRLWAANPSCLIPSCNNFPTRMSHFQWPQITLFSSNVTFNPQHSDPLSSYPS